MRRVLAALRTTLIALSEPLTFLRRHRWDLFAGILIAIITAFAYRGILGLWWTLDDPFHLHFLTDHPGFSWLRPSVWRLLPFRMFTPVLFASLQLDLSMSGFSPWHFYLHQLMALTGAGAATYALFRLWFPLAVALCGSGIVILGAPVGSIAQSLMLRHYIEGWLLAAIATILFVLCVRRARQSLALCSAVFYLGSALAKEIFAPLIVILFILPEGTWRERLRMLLPHALAMVAYAAGRWVMLGTFGGGYGWNTYAGELPPLIAGLPGRLMSEMFPGTAGLLLAVVILPGIIATLTSRNGLRLIVAILISVVPILPVAKAVEPRYALALWFTLVIFAVAGYATRLRNRIWVPLALLVIFTGAVHIRTWRDTFHVADRMSVEGRALMNLGASDALRHPAIPPAAMAELQWMKTVVYQREAGSWFFDDIYLCTPRPSMRRAFEYSKEGRALRDITAELPAVTQAACAARKAPLAADFSYDDGVLAWSLGPYAEGTYRVIINEGMQSFAVPARDSFQIGRIPGLDVRVRYDHPSGWRTYSDPIPLDFERRPKQRWQRPGG